MDDKSKKIVFHIVNSIKGGSGKSTVSFFLADHFNRESDSKAVIIDLDVNGSSWFNDHKIENYENNFIQNYFYKPEDILSRESARIVYRYQDKVDNNDGKIEAYLCDPKNSFLMSECDLDLFENLIFVIIKHVITNNNDKSLHIIFDMPPSYEEHADRIINHLLIDNNSPLYKVFNDKYRIIHYLICACTYSHIQLNKNYLHSIIEEKERSYSSAIKSFFEKEKYNFVFLINDLHGKIQERINNSSANKKEVKNRIMGKIKSSSINESMAHIAIANKYEYFYPTWKDFLENKATSVSEDKDGDENCFKVVDNMYDAMSDFYETVEGLLKLQ